MWGRPALFAHATLHLLLFGGRPRWGRFYTSSHLFSLALGKMLVKTYYYDEISRKTKVEAVEKSIDGKLPAIDATLLAAEKILYHKMTAVKDEVTAPKKEIIAGKNVAKSTESRIMSMISGVGGGGLATWFSPGAISVGRSPFVLVCPSLFRGAGRWPVLGTCQEYYTKTTYRSASPRATKHRPSCSLRDPAPPQLPFSPRAARPRTTQQQYREGPWGAADCQEMLEATGGQGHPTSPQILLVGP